MHFSRFNSQLGADLVNRTSFLKRLCQPLQEVTLMFLLETSSNVATGQRSLVCCGALCLKKTEQTRREGPETENGLACHYLVLITAQEILPVLKVGLHSSTVKPQYRTDLRGSSQLAHPGRDEMRILALEGHPSASHTRF